MQDFPYKKIKFANAENHIDHILFLSILRKLVKSQSGHAQMWPLCDLTSFLICKVDGLTTIAIWEWNCQKMPLSLETFISNVLKLKIWIFECIYDFLWKNAKMAKLSYLVTSAKYNINNDILFFTYYCLFVL